jgi:tetrahydromethanopterin S-methyltransferase subunit E
MAMAAKEKNKLDSALIRAQRSAILTGILFFLFVYIDPPVTILGWILSCGIALFLVYIIFQIYLLNRIPKS